MPKLIFGHLQSHRTKQFRYFAIPSNFQKDIVTLKEKKIRELKDKGVPENQLEHEFAKEVFIDNKEEEKETVEV